MNTNELITIVVIADASIIINILTRKACVALNSLYIILVPIYLRRKYVRYCQCELQYLARHTWYISVVRFPREYKWHNMISVLCIVCPVMLSGLRLLLYSRIRFMITISAVIPNRLRSLSSLARGHRVVRYSGSLFTRNPEILYLISIMSEKNGYYKMATLSPCHARDELSRECDGGMWDAWVLSFLASCGSTLAFRFVSRREGWRQQTMDNNIFIIWLAELVTRSRERCCKKFSNCMRYQRNISDMKQDRSDFSWSACGPAVCFWLLMGIYDEQFDHQNLTLTDI